MKTLPKLWKRTKRGKEYGSFWITAAGDERVNLRTTNPDVAKRRRLEAVSGARGFKQDDSGASVAAQAITPVLEGRESAQTLSLVEPPRPEAPAPSSPPASPPAAALPAIEAPPAPPVVPDAIFPPPPPLNGWADAVNGAAGAAAGASSSSGSDAGDEGGERVDADMLREMVEQAAAIVTECQIWVQSWAIKRGLKIRAAIVSDDAKGREVGRKLWSRCFHRLMPADLPIPDYIAAPILIAALTLPIQLGEGATEIRDEGAPAPASAPTAAAAA